MALKVTNNYDSINFNHSLNISKAVKYAVDHNANIINLSLQIRSNQNELKESIEYAISKGVVVVVAAGNNKKDVTGYYPAADKNVITVSSVDDEYNVAKFSNYGDSIDVAAPGVNIINWSSFNGYSMHSGTSISTGFTSAACALLLSDNINLTPKDIENILKNSTKDFANYSLKGFYGDGVIDLNKYLYYVRCGLDTTKLFID